MPIKKRLDYKERHKYACHKSKAKARGIEFNLTYEEWWEIWQKSGKWEKRGAGMNQYVMSRYNDSGAYEYKNVFIQPASANKREGNLGRKIPRTSEHQKNLTESLRKANLIAWNKGKSNPIAAINGQKGATKQSQTVTGRKRKYNKDGSWSWSYPEKVEA
jgi:hypothetical protein